MTVGLGRAVDAGAVERGSLLALIDWSEMKMGEWGNEAHRRGEVCEERKGVQGDVV